MSRLTSLRRWNCAGRRLLRNEGGSGGTSVAQTSHERREQFHSLVLVNTSILLTRLREAGVIVSQAVLIAIGIDWDGRRQVLAVELANRESRSSWRDFLLGLKARGLHGADSDEVAH
jgi:transposase-like protein